MVTWVVRFGRVNGPRQPSRRRHPSLGSGRRKGTPRGGGGRHSGRSRRTESSARPPATTKTTADTARASRRDPIGAASEAGRSPLTGATIAEAPLTHRALAPRIARGGPMSANGPDVLDALERAMGHSFRDRALRFQDLPP